MAIYQRKFTYRDKSNKDFGLIVTAFEPDNGEVDSYLGIDSIFTEKYNGTRRNDYGAKYNDVALLSITMIKENYADFSMSELRNAMEWLTSLHKVSWLDLYNDDDEIIYSFLGRFSDVKLQKMDARVIGIRAEFTSVSPWAYSNIHSVEVNVNGELICPLLNYSDESAVYIYPKIIFKNIASNGELKIKNVLTGKETVVSNLGENEIITMDSNQIIYSDKDIKVFGDDFNFEWLALTQGVNYINVTGKGHLMIEYRDIMKVSDAIYDFEGINDTSVFETPLLVTHIYMPADGWNIIDLEKEKYSQEIKIKHGTSTSKIDLQPDAEQLFTLDDREISLQIANNNGVFTAYSTYTGVLDYNDENRELGVGKPRIDYTMQATIEDTTKEIKKRVYTVTLYNFAWQEEGTAYKQYVYIRDITKNSIVYIEPSQVLLNNLDDIWTTLIVKNDKDGVCVYATAYKPKIDYTVKLEIVETTYVSNS